MKKLALDSIDIRILTALQQHGRLSKKELAEIVHLSPTPCWLRFNKLKDAGYIKAYRAEIELERIAKINRVVVTVSLKAHSREDFRRFESYILDLDEVVECHATGGGCDYVMTVLTANLEDFQALMEQMLNDEIGIDRYYIYIATKQVKSTSSNLAKLLAN
jgi:Lrp/AsnC family transcriptional regulator, regulator of ectoine-degradation genes